METATETATRDNSDGVATAIAVLRQRFGDRLQTGEAIRRQHANTITWIPNLLVRDIAVSDYDGLVERQDELNAKQTQISRVQAKHADPKLAMHSRNAGPHHLASQPPSTGITAPFT